MQYQIHKKFVTLEHFQFWMSEKNGGSTELSSLIALLGGFVGGIIGVLLGSFVGAFCGTLVCIMTTIRIFLLVIRGEISSHSLRNEVVLVVRKHRLTSIALFICFPTHH